MDTLRFIQTRNLRLDKTCDLVWFICDKIIEQSELDYGLIKRIFTKYILCIDTRKNLIYDFFVYHFSV